MDHSLGSACYLIEQTAGVNAPCCSALVPQELAEPTAALYVDPVCGVRPKGSPDGAKPVAETPRIWGILARSA